MNPEVSRYLGRFAAEAREHLQRLSDLLIRLEKAPAAEVSAVREELFRHAHSIKGGAGMMGLEASAQMAHHFEDWLSALRRLPEAEDGPLSSANLIDVLLVAVDHLGQLICAELRGAQLPERPEQLDRIDEQMALAARRELAAAQPAPPAAAPAPGADGQAIAGPRFRLRLSIAPSSQMTALRAFLAYKKLSALGPILALTPSLGELKAGCLPQKMIALDIAAELGAIERALRSLSDIERAEISALDAAAAALCPEARVLWGAPLDRSPGASPTATPQATASASAESQPADARAGALSLRGLDDGALSRTLRVKAELLDTLLDSAGDFILSIARLREQAEGMGLAAAQDGGAPSALREGLDALHFRARSLHSQVLAARTMPLSSITGQLMRAARDLSRQRGRELDFTVSGAEVALDHAVLDVLSDPLLHLIRNAVDHGLEAPDERAAQGKPRVGRLALCARREHAHVLIEIADDGRGISPQKIKAAARAAGLIAPSQCEALSEREALHLCFLPGLSTAEKIDDVSGRGVGMDAVKSAIEGVGGSIDLCSRPGQGTTWSLALPYTVAIAHVLFVRLGSERFGIPISRIAHVAMAPAGDFSVSRGQPFFSWRGARLPVFSLGARLRIEADFWPGDSARPLILVEVGDRLLALQVDALLGQQRSILRPLKPPLNRIPCLAGVTLEPSGQPAFILDVPRLFARLGSAF